MYIYGKNVANEKINSDEKINKIFLSDKFKDSEIMELIRKKKIKYSVVPSVVLDKKVTGLHQGIVIQVDDFETYDFDFITSIKKENPLIVMLDHLEDPHNFGAIIRTCEALGIDAIIIPNDRSVTIIMFDNPKNSPSAPISFTSPNPIDSFPEMIFPRNVIAKKIPAPSNIPKI